jgi:hypothetical protein
VRRAGVHEVLALTEAERKRRSIEARLPNHQPNLTGSAATGQAAQASQANAVVPIVHRQAILRPRRSEDLKVDLSAERPAGQGVSGDLAPSRRGDRSPAVFPAARAVQSDRHVGAEEAQFFRARDERAGQKADV